ncbi:Fc.00g081520.m01.CDS01 [Cosmosporella sp. VM-42]
MTGKDMADITTKMAALRLHDSETESNKDLRLVHMTKNVIKGEYKTQVMSMMHKIIREDASDFLLQHWERESHQRASQLRATSSVDVDRGSVSSQTILPGAFARKNRF